jgi:hypothetical protein
LSRMVFLCFWYKGHSRVKCSSSSIELLVQCWQSLSHLGSNSSFPETELSFLIDMLFEKHHVFEIFLLGVA